MQILDYCHEECAIALGNFDGLHRAHISIINACKNYAKEKKIKCGVLLFDRHTSEIFGGKIRLLTDMGEKLEILADMDFVHIMPFNEKTANLEGREFIDKLLENFNVKAFFAGYDYTFGKGAKGTAESLTAYGKEKGFEVYVTPRIDYQEERVSSSLIRELLEKGEMGLAAEFLGRRYSVSGKVVKGFGNGKKSLFPTANVEFGKDKFLPPDGVYAGIAVISGRKYRTAVNIGMNPTLNAKNRTIEAFILGFDGELYGESIKVEFIKKLRDDKRFESLEDLKRQIEKDINAVRQIEIQEEKRI